MKYQYLNISKGEDSYIVSSEFYKFRIEFSYDEDGTLLLHSYYGNGISLDMLDELEQFVMEEFEEDFEDCEEENEKDTKAEISTLFRAVKADKSGKIWQALKGLKNDTERIEALTEWCTDAEWFDKTKAFYNIGKDENWNKLNQENTKKSEQNAFEFHNEVEKILNESPEKFFSSFYIRGYFDQQEFAKNIVTEECLKQINEFYKIKYAIASSLSLDECVGYLFFSIHAIQEEYANILSIPSSCGILFFDVEHIYGIIEFKGFRRAFADVWNRQRGPQAPKLYPTDSDSMYLVKKFTANKSGKIIENEWDNFFSNFPSTVTRTYNEFMNK